MALDSVFRLSVVLGVVDNMTNSLKKIGGSVDKTMNEINANYEKITKVGTVMAGVGTAITGVALSTVKATFDTQDALGELASLGVENLEAVEMAAKNFSDTWAGTSKSDFISASYDIKSGIASLTDEGVAQFTSLAGLTAKATKATTSDMTSLFATGYGIYKDFYGDISDMEFGEMFSAGISTAVKNYKTSGVEMASAIESIGATATNANVPMEEQLAILGQLQATMSGSEAGTKYAAFIQAAASAGENLKLKFTDANNMLLSTPEILEQLKSKYGDTIDAVEKQELATAFGTDEAVDMIDLLYQKTDILESGISDLSSSMKKGTEVTNGMAEAIQNTPAQKFQTIKQQIHNNVEELGNGLLPVLNNTLDKVSGLIKVCSDWVTSNNSTVHTIMNIILYIGIFMVVIGSATVGIAKLSNMYKSLQTAISVVNKVVTSLNTSFLASPVTWIIIGIVALIATFVILYKNCEQFRTFWDNTFQRVKTVFSSAWNNIKPQIQALGEKIKQLGEAAKPIIEIIGLGFGVVLVNAISVFVGVLSGVANAAKPLVGALSDLVSFATNVVNVIVSLFKGDFSGACDYAKDAVDNLKSFFINGFGAITSFVSGFANGFLDTIGSALSSIGIDASGTISKMKNVVSNGMEIVKGAFSKGINAAAKTVKGTLNNMQSAYQLHGGGIKGIVAAAMEGVKGKYTAGFNFIDNLTGGKLSSIAGKVGSKFSSIVNKIGEKMNSAKQKVKSGIDKIKGFFDFEWSLPKLKMPHFSATGKFSLNPLSIPKFGVEWYKDGGIMTKPTIFGANGNNLMVGGEAGAEAVVPLSELWKHLKMFISEMFISRFNDTENPKSINLKEVFSSKSRKVQTKEKEISKENRTKEKATIIQKLVLNVDMSKIKDLEMLQRLIDELKDSQNSSDDLVTE